MVTLLPRRTLEAWNSTLLNEILSLSSFYSTLTLSLVSNCICNHPDRTKKESFFLYPMPMQKMSRLSGMLLNILVCSSSVLKNGEKYNREKLHRLDGGAP